MKAWIKVHSGQAAGNAEGFFGIDPTGGTDPNSAQIMWASKPWEYWSQDSWTVTAQNTVITVYLRGRATRLNQTAYIWLDDIELAPGHPPTSHPRPSARRPSAGGGRIWPLKPATASGIPAARTSPACSRRTRHSGRKTGLTPNTQYTRQIHAVNDCGESEASVGQTAWTLSAPPEAGSITPT